MTTRTNFGEGEAVPSVLRAFTPTTNVPERTYAIQTLLGRWNGVGVEIVPEEGRTSTTLCVDETTGSASVEVQENILLHPLDSKNPFMESGFWRRPIGDDDLARLAGLSSGAPSVDCLDGPVINRSGSDCLTVAIDIFGTTFAMLSGFEELFVVRDEFDRVAAQALRAVRDNFVDQPIVDELADLLWLVLARAFPQLQPRRPCVPTVVPTHDIDNLHAYGGSWRGVALTGVLRSRSGLRIAAKEVRTAVDVQRNKLADPVFSFEHLMEVAESSGRRAEFYFIPGPTRQKRTPLGFYRISDERLKPVFRSIVQRGHVIGIHPSYLAHNNVDQLSAEVESLRRAVRNAGAELDQLGGRHHYLRWSAERSPDAWEKAGLRYDSSVGFSDRCGFRAGTSRPYALWSFGKRRASTVVERPLIAMDSALSSDDLGNVHRLKNRCEQRNGTFTYLVHNCRISQPSVSQFHESMCS